MSYSDGDTENETAETLKQKDADISKPVFNPFDDRNGPKKGELSLESVATLHCTNTIFIPSATFTNKGAGKQLKKIDTAQKAAIFHEYGISTGLFPVADVATDPNAFIYDRNHRLRLPKEPVNLFVETLQF